MMYRNRALVAQEDLHLGTDYVTKGATFAATDTDADYLIGQKKAVEQDAKSSKPAPKSVATSAPAVEPEPVPEPMPHSRDDMLIQAAARGIKVDGRWSNQRLFTELAPLDSKA